MKVELDNVFMGILTLLFVTFKLTGVIDWSWWLVLLPLYGPVILFLILGLIIYIVNNLE